ncbi:MAG: ankyrin repeat domain-containing protein [Gammaproteobacteria bacterium]|nr:ankyrin repeat domain-containing protein [Gammaproteobacteria bacterium]
MNSQSLQQSKELLSRFKDTEIAVVAYADKKEEAQKIFKNYTVFTPEDIKGLEYKCVITYQLFDTAFFKEANKALKTVPEKAPVYRAKPDEARPLFAPCFNGVFTAFTRAQNALVIMQDKLSGLEHLISPIKDIVDKANQKIPLSTNTKTITQSVKTTTEDWKKHVDDLLYQGKNQVAEDVFNQRLKATLLLSFEEYQKKKTAPLAKSSVQIIHKNNLPNKELSKKPQIEIKPSTKSSRQINKQNQSIQSVNKKKNTELLSTKPSYLLNHFTESFLELFLNHENLCQYRTLPLPQFNNQTFLDVIICDKNKRQVLEQLLTKKPFLFRRFFTEIELVNIEFFQYIQHQDCFDEIMFKRYCTDLNNLLSQFSYPGFMVNHIVTLRSRTLLAIAIEAKIEECVNFLINIKGIDVNKELYIDGRTPLIWAIQSGNLNIVNLLLNLKEIDVNKSDKEGLTPLLVAVNRNNINMVNALLNSKGIDINKSSEDDLTPLSIAASDDQNIDVLHVLLKMKGIDIEDLSPLFVAVEMGQKKSVRALLNFFDPDARVLEQVWIFAKKNHSDERIIELLEYKLNSVNLKNESSIKVFNESGFSILFFKQTTNEIEETECDHSSKPALGKKT